MKHSFTLIVGLLAATVALPAAALAQARGPMSGESPQMTREAAARHAAAMFARLDANSDGKIDPADRQARITQRQEAHFARHDTNGDGTISREEWAAAGDEVRARRGEREAHRPMMERPMRPRMGLAPASGNILAGADADGDRAITEAEFNAAMLARFDRMDANADGTITAEERRAAGRRDGRGPRPGLAPRDHDHGQRNARR